MSSFLLLDELINELGYTHESILNHFMKYLSEDQLIDALDQFYINNDLLYKDE